jgi:hypothetical protein
MPAAALATHVSAANRTVEFDMQNTMWSHVRSVLLLLLLLLLLPTSKVEFGFCVFLPTKATKVCDLDSDAWVLAWIIPIRNPKKQNDNLPTMEPGSLVVTHELSELVRHGLSIEQETVSLIVPCLKPGFELGANKELLRDDITGEKKPPKKNLASTSASSAFMALRRASGMSAPAPANRNTGPAKRNAAGVDVRIRHLME